MEDIVFATFALSMAAFLILLVMVPIKLIFKRGIRLKRIFTSMGVLVVIMIISVILTPAPEETVADSDKDTQSERKTEPKKPEQDKKDEKSGNNKEKNEIDAVSDDQNNDDKNENEKAEKAVYSNNSVDENEENADESNDVNAEEKKSDSVKYNVYKAANKKLNKVKELLGEGNKINEGTFDSYGSELPTETYSYEDGVCLAI